MNLKTTLMIASMAAMFGGVPLIDNTEPKEPPGPPRQPEVDELSKKARKVYAKILVDTQSREKALEAAREIDNATQDIERT